MSAIDGIPVDTPPFEVIQAALRRLSNGDYMRIEVERYGTRIRISLGTAEGDSFIWRWEMILNPDDIGWIVRDLGYTTALFSEHGTGIMSATQGMLEDARRRLTELQQKEQTHG